MLTVLEAWKCKIKEPANKLSDLKGSASAWVCMWQKVKVPLYRLLCNDTNPIYLPKCEIHLKYILKRCKISGHTSQYSIKLVLTWSLADM